MKQAILQSLLKLYKGSDHWFAITSYCCEMFIFFFLFLLFLIIFYIFDTPLWWSSPKSENIEKEKHPVAIHPLVCSTFSTFCHQLLPNKWVDDNFYYVRYSHSVSFKPRVKLGRNGRNNWGFKRATMRRGRKNQSCLFFVCLFQYVLCKGAFLAMVFLWI